MSCFSCVGVNNDVINCKDTRLWSCTWKKYLCESFVLHERKSMSHFYGKKLPWKKKKGSWKGYKKWSKHQSKGSITHIDYYIHYYTILSYHQFSVEIRSQNFSVTFRRSSDDYFPANRRSFRCLISTYNPGKCLLFQSQLNYVLLFILSSVC